MSVNEVYGLSLHEYGGKENHNNTNTKQWKSLADLLEKKDNFVTVYSFPFASGTRSRSSGSLEKCGRSNNVFCSADGGLSGRREIEAKQMHEYMEANTDTGYVSASEGTYCSSEMGLNTSFCSISVSGSSRERSPLLPVLSRPGHCLHAFTYQTLDEDEDEETGSTNAEPHRDHEAVQVNLVASDTAPAITCLVPTDKYLKCVGESHIFLRSAEQEPFTPKELGSVDIDCKDSMDISDGINTKNRGVASMVIKEKQNASQEDAESEISEVGIDCKEEKTPNQEAKYLSLNNNENPCEVSVTPSGIIQLPEGWMFFDMTPDNIAGEDHHSRAKDTSHLLSVEQKPIRRQLQYTLKEQEFIKKEDAGKDMDCTCCFCTIL